MAKIVIDAGHGGDDPGASGNGIVEKNLTLDISNYMYDRLRNSNIPVAMTRTTDETLSPTERVNRILSKYGDSSDVIVVSNHINAGGGDGAEVIYALRDTDRLSNLILDNLESAGQNIRDAFQRRLPSDPSKDYYFIHRNTGRTEPVIVEYGFLDSSGDDVTQLKNNWQRYADAVVNALLQYIGVQSGGSGTYTVRSGDSLWSIAKRYNTTVNELKSLNNLTSNTLSIGQVLKVPNGDTNGNIYIVKSGDTLYAIANRYGVTVNALKSANNLTSNSLSIGQRLTIPSTGATTPPSENIEDYIVYTVKSGDTLYRIANSYNLAPSDLMEYNNLSSTVLNIGQTLKIPYNVEQEEITTEYTQYTVKSGDSLYSIARNYGVSVNDIMNYNNLSSNLLSIGQVLRIPVATTETITYTVKSGDSLYSIARQYNTTVDEIKRKNNLSSNLLNIGQVLRI